MPYEDLREKGLIEDIKPNFQVVSALIARALKDLVTARANASIDREWAYAIAYQGMLRAARAMITAEGLRPRGRDQSRTVVLLAGAILGDPGGTGATHLPIRGGRGHQGRPEVHRADRGVHTNEESPVDTSVAVSRGSVQGGVSKGGGEGAHRGCRGKIGRIPTSMRRLGAQP